MSEESGSMELVAKIVAAYVGNNSVASADLPGVISSVYRAIVGAGADPAAPEVEQQKPAVSVRKSIAPDYLVCLEDGKKLKMLKRHLMTAYGMTPDQYRAKWQLPNDYPMVAPNYAATRSALARSIGLGRRAAPPPEPAPAAKRVGRPRKQATV
jgi:predicted transcriptional regulator